MDLGERLTGSQEVMGSIPTVSTKFILELQNTFYLRIKGVLSILRNNFPISHVMLTKAKFRAIPHDLTRARTAIFLKGWIWNLSGVRFM